MEKNQIIGFTLISTILVGYMFWQEAYAPEPVPVEQVVQTEKVEMIVNNLTNLLMKKFDATIRV